MARCLKLEQALNRLAEVGYPPDLAPYGPMYQTVGSSEHITKGERIADQLAELILSQAEAGEQRRGE